MQSASINNEPSLFAKRKLLLAACFVITLFLLLIGGFHVNSKSITSYTKGYKATGIVKQLESVTNYSSNILTRDVTLDKITTPAPNFNTVSKNSIQKAENTATLCPDTPPDLIGRVHRTSKSDTIPPSLEEIHANNPRLDSGGTFSPTHCRAHYKLAIIIPLRGRETQLRTLLAHMHPIWQRQQLDYTVYTVWQSGENLFNRAKLINIGFTEASKERKYDCYVFHDVDLLLYDDRCLYWCPEDDNPRSVSVLIDKFHYKPISYSSKCAPEEFRKKEKVHLFGGVSMLTPKQFHDINGCSNAFWGWGGEDDDLYIRLWKKGYKIGADTHNKTCVFHMIKHTRESSNAQNGGRWSLIHTTLLRMEKDGLNSLKYNVSSLQREPLYTNITVDVGIPSKEYLEFMGLKKFYCNRPPPTVFESFTSE